MTRNILPKSDKLHMQMNTNTNKCFSPNMSSLNKNDLKIVICNEESDDNHTNSKFLVSKMNSSSLSSSDEDDRLVINNLIDINKNDNLNNNNHNLTAMALNFSTTRLNQWHTNEEIFNILTAVNGNSTPDTLKNDVIQRPNNGSIFLFDRRVVKNFKKDSFMWKRRKTGGTNSVREDRMYLKVNGVDCIYGCYSHSSIMSTFHRRCYWLVDKPDIVLVHYLQTPNNETGECSINLNFGSNLNNSDINTDNSLPLNRDELCNELKAMIWPYYLIDSFLSDNKNIFLNESNTSSNDFIDSILGRIFKNNLNNTSNNTFFMNSQLSLRINLTSFLNQSTNDILSKLKITTFTDLENIVSKSSDSITSPQLNQIKLDFESSNNHQIPQNKNDILKVCNNDLQMRALNNKVELSINSCSENVNFLRKIYF
jgi:hypothetical protein